MHNAEAVRNAIKAEFPIYTFVCSYSTVFVGMGVIAIINACASFLLLTPGDHRAFWLLSSVVIVCGVPALVAAALIFLFGPFEPDTNIGLLAQAVADPSAEFEYVKTKEQVRITTPERCDESGVVLGRNALIVMEAQEITITKKEADTLSKVLAQHAPEILAGFNTRGTLQATADR